MPSMSVKNRVAMFEPSGESENAEVLAPTPPGRSFGRPKSNGSEGANRASWPWPAEDNVIPVPKKEQTGVEERRYSSPYIPKSGSSPSGHGHESPNNKALVSSSPLKHLQNQGAKTSMIPFDPTGMSPKERMSPKVAMSPKAANERRDVSWLAPKHDLHKRDPAPTGAFDADENQVPAAVSGRTKALFLAKQKNSKHASGLKSSLAAAKVVLEEEKSAAGSSTASSRSSLSNNELSSIANRALSMSKDKMVQSSVTKSNYPKSLQYLKTLPDGRESTDFTPSVTEQSEATSASRMTRAGKMAHALRRAGTSEPDASFDGQSVRSQSPLRQMRGSRTVSNVSHQQARKALLQAAQRKKGKVIEVKGDSPTLTAAENEFNQTQPTRILAKNTQGGNSEDVADRLALKAASVLAIKNSSKILAQVPSSASEMEISSSASVLSVQSIDSATKRRLNHPAFTSRAPSPRPNTPSSEKPPTGPGGAKPFAEEFISSFRQFKESRPDVLSGAQGSMASFDRSITPVAELSTSSSGNQVIPAPPKSRMETSKNTQGRPPQPQTVPSPMARRSPQNLRDTMAQGNSSVSQSFDYSQASPINDAGNASRLSIDSADSNLMEQEESLHSMSERNYDRKCMEWQPKYAPPRQSFQKQEGGYLSSLSSNAFSNLSMISGANEPSSFALRVAAEVPTPLGELSAMSPGRSMRSGHSFSMRSSHSLAHSMISVSPKGDTPKYNAEFDYLMRSPSKQSGVDAHASDMMNQNGVPPQIDEGDEPTVGLSLDGGASEPTVTFSEPTEGFSEPTVGFSVEGVVPDPAQLIAEIKETILPLELSNSLVDAPPGFAFGDSEDDSTEDVKKVQMPDPVGASFGAYDMPDDLFGANLSVASCADKEETSHRTDPSFGTELEEGGLKVDSVLKFSMDDRSALGKPGKPDLNVVVDRSTSTKGTASTSLRTGISSVQIGNSDRLKSGTGPLSPREGSTSIRTGLSGIQNRSDLDGSTSMRSVSVSMKSMAAPNNDSMKSMAAPNTDASGHQRKSAGRMSEDNRHSQHQTKTVNLPDTIAEASDDDYSGMKSSKQESQSEMKDGSTLLCQTTATTDTSSNGSAPQSSDSSGSGSDTMGGNNTRFTAHTGFTNEHSESDSEPPKPLIPHLLAPLITRREKMDEDPSVASSPASSRHSRWKMKMPNVIKSVLAKASPRHVSTTPGSKGKINIKTGVDKTGFSSSEDEEDDIFGGLEDEVSRMFSEPVTPRQTSMGRVTPKRRTTPRQAKQVHGKFFNSGHTRRSEPPKSSAKESSTSNNRSSRTEIRITTPNRKKRPVNKFSLRNLKMKISSPTATNPNSLFSSDRSGTVVDSEMQHVSSDITSSILGAPGRTKLPILDKPARRTPKNMGTEDPFDETDKAQAKTPKMKTSKKTPSSTKSRSSKKSKSSSHSRSKSNDKKSKKIELPEPETVEEIKVETVEETSAGESKSKNDGVKDPPGSMFMNLSCGFSEGWEAVANVCHFGAKDTETEDDEVEAATVEDEGAALLATGSQNSSSHLTELEKRVWNEWDKLDTAFKPNQPAGPEKKEEHDKKREVAHGKLLGIASSAISSQNTKEGHPGDSAQSGSAGSASYTTGSSGDSGETGGSSGMTGSSSVGHTTNESNSYLSGSDMASDVMSRMTQDTKDATPILLSFSQRSLIEKFSKQLSAVGVKVLKLNRRKQWQVRHFTVSKEQIALIAHAANNKSAGDVARCPKALLWLKKFNANGAGYGLSNIDKNGHGGMLLVDLNDVRVTTTQDLENPMPKKLSEAFKESVLVTLDYEMNGEKRSIEFRCKDNDEAQFLCTCMRVIRDLLKREQALRQKTQAKALPKSKSQKKK